MQVPAANGGQLYYQNAPTDLKLSDTALCFKYIGDKVVPSLLDEIDTEQCYIRYLSKSTKIPDYVEDLVSQFTAGKTLVLYSYGSHVQRAVTLIELVKKQLAGETFDLLHSNKLSCFVNVVPGRNELLERKINVPILVAVMSHFADAPVP